MLGLAATAAQADTINFVGISTPVADLQWLAGNALAHGAVPSSPGTLSTLYYQAVLSQFNDAGGAPISGTGLNTSFYITAIAAFGEVTTPFSTATVGDFALAPGYGPNYFDIFYHTGAAPVGIDLSGVGFDSGTLIMSGTVIDAGGSFAIISTKTPALDNFTKAAYWAGEKTVTGSGGTSATVDVGYINPAYITTSLSQFNISLDYTGGDATPFTHTSPAEQFVTPYGTIAVNNTATSLGTINGQNGSDILFQAQGDSTVTVAPVPEPSTMVLLGAGLFGMSVFARRRKES
jgi:hypothetical protein